MREIDDSMSTTPDSDTSAEYPEPGPPQRTRARARQPLPERADVAIIGCGLGGLTAGAYLAKRGLKVALFDGHYVAGGSATVFTRGKGESRYTFDIGLHYVGDCGPDGEIPRILRDVGAEVEFIPMDEDGFDTFVFPDFEFAVPANLELYQQRLIALFPQEKRGIERYVKMVRAVGDLARRMSQTGGKMTAATLWRVLSRHRMVIPYQNASAAKFLDSCTRDPRLRAVMLGQHGDYALPPSQVSVLMHVGLAAHYFGGAYYPKGGGQTIADTLCAVIEGAGGSIHLRQPIAKVLIEGGRAVGIVTEERRNHPAQTVRAETVISNADITRTLTELVGNAHLPAKWRSRVGDFKMAGALFITCLGVDIPPERLASPEMGAMGPRNYWVFDGYDFEGMYSAAADSETLKTTGAYITSASFKDPSNPHHAPAGITNVEVMTIVPGSADKWGLSGAEAGGWNYKRHPGYQALKARVEDAMIGYLDQRFPGTGDKIVFRESATPVTHSRYTGALAGTSYGLAATPDLFGPKRPGYGPVIDGLYLCGASTRAGHGIVGAMSSGRAAAKRVLKHRISKRH